MILFLSRNRSQYLVPHLDPNDHPALFRFRFPCQMFRQSGSQILIHSLNQHLVPNLDRNPDRFRFRSHHQSLALILQIQISHLDRERIRCRARVRCQVHCRCLSRYLLQFPYHQSRQHHGRSIRLVALFPSRVSIRSRHLLIITSP